MTVAALRGGFALGFVADAAGGVPGDFRAAGRRTDAVNAFSGSIDLGEHLC
jgi:hypothetical protein